MSNLKKNSENTLSFYVYVHRRSTDNTIFYVGKGVGNRITSKTGRNKWWKSVAQKNGYITEYVRGCLTNREACELEEDLIKGLRSFGCNLCNIYAGGESGAIGISISEDQKEALRKAHLGKKQSPEHARLSAIAKVGKKQPRDAVEKTIQLKRKPVINSDGEVFNSATEAARRLSSLLGVYVSQGNISMVCRGERHEAYGLTWSYDTSKRPMRIKADGPKKRIKCSNGMLFESATLAAKWVKSWRGSSNIQSITAAARGNKNNAYGYAWRYVK